MPILPWEHVCSMCGDILELWARGRWALVLCFGTSAPDDRWQVWRCPSCGFCAIH
jgi:predicted RNA-binding Zn-ribbon protein involved in translation (DUF1610 family)